MQGIVYMPDGQIQTGSSPPHRNIVPQTNMELSSELQSKAEEFLKNQSNRSDSGILSGNSTLMDVDRSNRSENEDTDNRSNNSSPDRKYVCPICEIMLTSQHEFTNHIRSHNNETEVQESEKGFTCRICFKVLSSSASLDRHMLIHSGERPFTCKYCGDTFTTNGNMHRHMRIHTLKSENYESDESTDSGNSNKSRMEYNNNKISTKDFDPLIESKTDGKRKLIDDCDTTYKKARIKLEDAFNKSDECTFSCSVCERDDFNSIEMLQIHLEDNHPDYPAQCNKCTQSFENTKLLNEHKLIVHINEDKFQKNSVVGFKDLTFVDFSSQKFPYIAKYECEKNLHKVASGLRFQCDRCSRAFPCASSLEIHQSDCTVGLDLTIKDVDKNTTIEKDLRRNDFFAKLDLQNNAALKREYMQIQEKLARPPPNILSTDGKDLADIQSILSMTTNGTLLQQLQNKNDLHPTLRAYNETENNQKQENEEESQDSFAAEFRKMKVRGEFPCRLCKAVFPNLRALKGHNRAHLTGNNNGTYRCNMCPHSSIDKAALIRHMRTHNGDRPYECALCNYAFTTKANCERHLRNRHAKSTREEVKKSIIYHPSEDPSNEEISKMLAREEKINMTKEVSPPENHKPEAYLPTPDLSNLLPEKVKDNVVDLNLLNNSHFKYNNQQGLNKMEVPDVTRNDIRSKESIPLVADHIPPYVAPFNFSPKITNVSTPQNTPLKINVKNLETLQSSYDSTIIDNAEETFDSDVKEEPMDIALDLSTKRTKPIPEKKDVVIKEEKDEEEDLPQDLSRKNSEEPPQNMTEILARQLLKNSPKIDPAGLYASQLAFYRNGFPGLPGIPTWPFQLNPLFFQSLPSPLIPQDPQEIKERLQRLQLCGGGMVMDNFTERLKTFHQQPFPNPTFNAYNNFKFNSKNDFISHEGGFQNSTKSEDVKPLSLSVEPSLSDSLIKMQSPISTTKSEQLGSPNSVKMVIKNGVLMPKQKQRRYRTERPFSCEYCSARFTLRSNMERHIKQQHPQYWSQRQRTNIGSGTRKSGGSGHRNNFNNINIPSYESQIKSEYDEIKDNHISEKMKYVILAQHLKAGQNYKSTNKHEDEEDYPLIIDEKDESVNKNDAASPKESEQIMDNNNDEDLDKSQKHVETSEFENNRPTNLTRNEDVQDLVPVSRLLDNASQQPFKEYFRREAEGREGGISEEDEEGLVASCSTSDGNNSGTDENKSECENTASQLPVKKKSAYSLAPNRVSCPYCQRKFPWTSSLRRHVLTHTGQKPFKCSHCPLLFTTKSNCDRHLLRKHGNSASAINNDVINSNSNYMMRNVPERPFKCSTCPSSTFSTYSNLKKHISCKHSLQGAQSDDARSQISTGYEAGSSEDEKMPQNDQKREWDKQLTTHNKTNEVQNSHMQNSELPFKCHLCDSSFGDRNDALDHIKDKHSEEYKILLSKNALDVSATTPDDNPNHDDNEDNEVRGKFPDYANRKVICAFCMRRFWSAEDLRRHMRTHTGERPFSCDICHRRFTLKHSMLRHRKKHNVSFDIDNLNSDEDVNNMNSIPTFNKFIKGNNNSSVSKIDKTDESDGAEGSDLISNLLGIRDRSIIDQVLTSSADDAAKLLGVKGGDHE